MLELIDENWLHEGGNPYFFWNFPFDAIFEQGRHFFEVDNLAIEYYVRVKRVGCKNMGYFDEIWMTSVTLKVLGPNKDIFVHLAFHRDESTLRLKISKTPPMGSCTSTLLKFEKEIDQFGHVITKFWAPKSTSLMIDCWAAPNKLCMLEIVGIMAGLAKRSLDTAS